MGRYSNDSLELLDSIRNNKKINPSEYENKPFEKSSFIVRMKLEDVRMRMRISSGMINQIKGNYKQKYRKMNQSITCISCKNINSEKEGNKEPEDTQLHLIEECEAFEDLRSNTDLSKKGRVSFFLQRSSSKKDKRR